MLVSIALLCMLQLQMEPSERREMTEKALEKVQQMYSFALANNPPDSLEDLSILLNGVPLKLDGPVSSHNLFHDLMLFKFYDEVMELLKTCVPQYVEFATGQNLGLADGEGIDYGEEGEKQTPSKKRNVLSPKVSRNFPHTIL